MKKNKSEYFIQLNEKQRKLKKYKKNLRKKATESEIIFRKILKKNNIKHTFQKGLIAGNNFCIADFYIPEKKLIIEIDGDYHLTRKQKYRDFKKDEYYKMRGFNILRIKNKDVIDFDINIINKIKPPPIKKIILNKNLQ